MKKRHYCQFCGDEIDLGRELVYQMDAADWRELVPWWQELMLARDPRYYGEPLRVCATCEREAAENRAEKETPGWAEGLGSAIMRVLIFGSMAATALMVIAGFIEWLEEL